jgi:hypothetical protein
MQIKKFEDHYRVKSESSDQWYEVFPDRPFCTCPAFIFYSVKRGTVCKHVKAVQDKSCDADGSGVIGVIDVIEYVKSKGEVDSIELIEKFGEAKVNSLVKAGELLEKAGRISIL